MLKACMVDQEPWGSLEAPEQSIYGEVFAEIGKLAGVRIEYSVSPLARALDDVRTGFCQFTITSWHPSRAAKLKRGEILTVIDYGVLPRRGLSLAGEADLKGLTVAIARGLLIGAPFDGDADIRKDWVYGYEQAVRMTEVGRADGAAGSIMTLARFARLHGTTDWFGPPLVLSKVALAVHMNTAFGATATAGKVDEAVATLRDSGRAGEIIASHFAP